MPPPAQKEETSKVHEVVEEVKAVVAPQQTMEKVRLSKVADASEATHESVSVKEPASQGSAPLPDEEVQQKPVSSEAGNYPDIFHTCDMFFCIPFTFVVISCHDFPPRGSVGFVCRIV